MPRYMKELDVVSLSADGQGGGDICGQGIWQKTQEREDSFCKHQQTERRSMIPRGDAYIESKAEADGIHGF
jgi:hypothetical protein